MFKSRILPLAIAVLIGAATAAAVAQLLIGVLSLGSVPAGIG